jgi:uncharacterized membrane protein
MTAKVDSPRAAAQNRRMNRGLLPRALAGEPHFRWRGGDVSRLEALADGVFALALTLLIVSLEVPRSFAELATAFRQIPVFAVCFVFLIWIWHCHYQFHRRYGFENTLTVCLNGVLLFAVLVYVYPLKYLFTLLFEMFFGIEGAVQRPTQAEWPILMMLYSSGVVLIFALFSTLTAYALGKREELELDEAELLITRATLRSHLISAGVGVVSILIALLTPRLHPLAGMAYFLMGPLQGLNGWLTGRALERIDGA